MKAARVLRFGPPSVITEDEVPRPELGAGQLLVRVKAAGVGNWDALIREGKVKLQPLPLILGAELSGIVAAIGADVSGFKVGDEVYGATNEQFSGAYGEYALPFARMMAQKPQTLTFVEAASAPVVTVTAWQMLFEYAQVTVGQSVLIHGAAGNVGAYAVQLARQAGLHVVATAASADLEYVRGLGAERVVDYQKERFEESLTGVDVVLDTVGGDTQQRSLRVLKPGGILVSVVSPVSDAIQKSYGVRAAYFYVDVTTARLNKITELFDSGKLATDVGTVLPLEEVRIAHEMLDGARFPPHRPLVQRRTSGGNIRIALQVTLRARKATREWPARATIGRYLGRELNFGRAVFAGWTAVRLWPPAPRMD
jgi:NADPH:quinone reductase-like Zn-dependent oxidoreductase